MKEKEQQTSKNTILDAFGNKGIGLLLGSVKKKE